MSPTPPDPDPTAASADHVPRLEDIEVVDDAMARVYAAMTGAERIAVADRLFRSTRRMIVHHLRSEHPDWSDERIEREASGRISGGAL